MDTKLVSNAFAAQLHPQQQQQQQPPHSQPPDSRTDVKLETQPSFEILYNNKFATFSVPGCDHAEHAALRACLLAGLGPVGTMLAEKPLRPVRLLG
jgi:hypothetical protein